MSLSTTGISWERSARGHSHRNLEPRGPGNSKALLVKHQREYTHDRCSAQFPSVPRGTDAAPALHGGSSTLHVKEAQESGAGDRARRSLEVSERLLLGERPRAVPGGSRRRARRRTAYLADAKLTRAAGGNRDASVRWLAPCRPAGAPARHPCSTRSPRERAGGALRGAPAIWSAPPPPRSRSWPASSPSPPRSRPG